jgi:hypothetical protein
MNTAAKPAAAPMTRSVRLKESLASKLDQHNAKPAEAAINAIIPPKARSRDTSPSRHTKP